jgi:hypothetical protein
MRSPLATGMFFGPWYVRFRARNWRAGTATPGRSATVVADRLPPLMPQFALPGTSPLVSAVTWWAEDFVAQLRSKLRWPLA